MTSILLSAENSPAYHSYIQVFCQAFEISLGKHAWVAILVIPVVVYCWIRNLEELALFSLIANLCILFSLVVIFYEEIYSFM